MKKWLQQRLAAFSRDELANLFNEIAEYRRTGMLKGNKLESLESEVSEEFNTPAGENLRLVEDEILFEISRRYVTNT